jgi:hypothetical protein
MRKGLIVVLLVAFIAMPIVLDGVGFCRSMPCCSPSTAGDVTAVLQADCCNTSNCGLAPAASGEYATSKETREPHPATTLASVAVIPASPTIEQPSPAGVSLAPVGPPPLQRRIAILSTLLI